MRREPSLFRWVGWGGLGDGGLEPSSARCREEFRFSGKKGLGNGDLRHRGGKGGWQMLKSSWSERAHVWDNPRLTSNWWEW